jgi:hypothetical protein
MKEKIGETAGKIWSALKESDEISVTQLPKVINEKQVIVYQSLGWLAREGKIKYNTKGKKTAVSLLK